MVEHKKNSDALRSSSQPAAWWNVTASRSAPTDSRSGRGDRHRRSGANPHGDRGDESSALIRRLPACISLPRRYAACFPRRATPPTSRLPKAAIHPCSFCIIPQLRGRLSESRRFESVVREAENLAASRCARSHAHRPGHHLVRRRSGPAPRPLRNLLARLADVVCMPRVGALPHTHIRIASPSACSTHWRNIRAW